MHDHTRPVTKTVSGQSMGTARVYKDNGLDEIIILWTVACDDPIRTKEVYGGFR